MNTPYAVAELCAARASGQAFAFLPFWGHEVRRDGKIGAECLSQFYPAPLEVGGVTYATAEHYFMTKKARLFGDARSEAAVLRAPTPLAAKRLGRAVAGFDEQTWVQHRFDIVVRGSVAKFGAHPALRAFLLATDNAVLVEASPYDRIWGVGLAQTDPRIQQPEQWPGTNLLGFALMKARDVLRSQGAP
jgi:ribA/ribD-fused uncharacterized protein